MSRRLKLSTRELGDLELLLIYQYGTTWEKEWASLQGLPLASHFTIVSDETMNHALRGWTSPLVKALGLSPELTIRRLNPQESKCWKNVTCPFFNRKECLPSHPKMPWCFEPSSIEDLDARTLAAEAIKLWRQGVYILVVTHAEQQ